MRRPSSPQTKIAAGILAAAVGFLAVIQARQEGDPVGRLEAESPEDLASILADLNTEADALAQRVSSLRVQIERYRSSSQRGRLALEDARESLADLEVLAGGSPAEGPGVTLTINDPPGRVGWEAILDLVQEIRDAGAEALSVGGMRIVVSTWFGPAAEGLSVDGRAVSPPYRLSAIGEQDALGEALKIQGGPLSIMAAQPGVSVSIAGRDSLVVPALPEAMAFHYARPAS